MSQAALAERAGAGHARRYQRGPGAPRAHQPRGLTPHCQHTCVHLPATPGAVGRCRELIVAPRRVLAIPATRVAFHDARHIVPTQRREELKQLGWAQDDRVYIEQKDLRG